MWQEMKNLQQKVLKCLYGFEDGAKLQKILKDFRLFIYLLFIYGSTILLTYLLINFFATFYLYLYFVYNYLLQLTLTFPFNHNPGTPSPLIIIKRKSSEKCNLFRLY